MKEYQRQIAVEQISKEIKEKESLQLKYQALESLKKEPKVIEYFELMKEIEEIETKYEHCKTNEKIIEYVFRRLMNDEFKCHHEIWLYLGSYYLSIDTFTHEHDHLIRKYDENLSTTKGDFEFRYNSYICLECGKKIETEDWKKFEKDNYVLKKQNENDDIRSYISLYYQSLYIMEQKEAQNKVIQAFNIEKAKTKTKTITK